jgi:hypothetical protein
MAVPVVAAAAAVAVPAAAAGGGAVSVLTPPVVVAVLAPPLVAPPVVGLAAPPAKGQSLSAPGRRPVGGQRGGRARGDPARVGGRLQAGRPVVAGRVVGRGRGAAAAAAAVAFLFHGQARSRVRGGGRLTFLAFGAGQGVQACRREKSEVDVSARLPLRRTPSSERSPSSLSLFFT